MNCLLALCVAVLAANVQAFKGHERLEQISGFSGYGKHQNTHMADLHKYYGSGKVPKHPELDRFLAWKLAQTERGHPDAGTAFAGALPEHLIHYVIREAHKKDANKIEVLSES